MPAYPPPDALVEADAQQPSIEAERRRMVDRRRDLEERREGWAAELAELQDARRAAVAKLQETEGVGSVQRVRLEQQIADAKERIERVSSWEATHEAEEEKEKLAENLAAFEEDLAREIPRLRLEIDRLDDRLNDRKATLNNLDGEMGLLLDEIRTLDVRRQANQAAEIEQQLESLAPVVEAQREAAGISGFAKLSTDYDAQADDHARAWKRWGAGLLISVAGSVVGSLLLFASERIPSGRIDNETVVTISRNLVVLGLLLYVVRLASLQFRVHRHLEAVARNKAAALSTFNRIIAVASEQEIRNAMATVLAQAVFSSDETGFVDGGNDHITLIERVASSVPRPSA